MAGDPANAMIWPDADVYVGPTTATDPANVDAEFGVDWDLVGLLNGDSGFNQSRSEDVNDHYAWGGILVRTSRRNFKLTMAFTALEDNDVTRDLVWPDSPAGTLVVPRPKRIKIAFETREGGKVKRLISAYEAEVSLNGDLNDNENSLTNMELLATIFPDTSTSPATLFNTQETDVASA
jgi:hypothetical protein